MAAVGFTDLPSTVHFIFEYKNELDAASAKALGKALADTCEMGPLGLEHLSGKDDLRNNLGK